VKLAYYPGCLLTKSAREYDDSLRECVRLLGDELVEILARHCCGGVSFAAVKEALTADFAESILQSAAETGADALLVPCPYCHDNLRLSGAGGAIELFSTAAYLIRSRCAKALSAMKEKGWEGLKAAFFPGCRAACSELDSQAAVKSLLEGAGVTWVNWAEAGLCCGGWRAEALPGEALEHVIRVLSGAREAQAQAVVTLCPVCQTNLDVLQVDAERRLARGLELPVFFATELLAHALGSKRTSKWLRRHITSPEPLIMNLLEHTRETVPPSGAGEGVDHEGSHSGS